MIDIEGVSGGGGGEFACAMVGTCSFCLQIDTVQSNCFLRYMT